MTYAENLWLFSALLAGIIIVPGMDMIFVIANGLTGGRRAGVAATSGIMLGGVFHTLFGTIAVTVLSTLVPQLAGPMLVIGSAYMIWIGYTLARSAIVIDGIEASNLHRTARIFGQGLITCLLNPKAWLFILAVYPQFMRPEYGPFWRQALVMGALTLMLQGLVYGGLAFAAAKGRDALVSKPEVTIWIGRAAGWLLVAVAALMLVEGWRSW
ncbi:MAG: LysE family translocator [Alphaproteobacteria bacterium]|uniref:LysE family translocator n=1 Tax=Rhizobium/Agrobacterium group TaxID=227290 RepID=UPI00083E1AE3|nr:LysE family translocator [Agrobacterium sp. RAC06]MBU0736803.1 LysE family translocator [Alphaproteobacteria bacterium]MDM7982619.1 LysE family translocator [Rhizobium sp.]AOG11171.1 lysE type translocator family protein [Agrobacterium sp. RAC06]MBU0831657.1 LysE family translocator [Alphaproteobacteria bacterium]MBU1766415.1 LysE family translocator [Alphaproteobacteria bacterium]